MTPRKTSADIPAPYDRIFEQYGVFNDLQSTLLPDLLHSDKSVVLSAPTGSGKTVAFELAVVRMLQQSTLLLTPAKAVYVAPIKALCAEKFHDWQLRFDTLPVQLLILTGDTDVSDLSVLRSETACAQLIVTTPEKWDALTRQWRAYVDVVSAVRLFMVDEVHLLGVDVRGPTLEAIVSRMKTIAGDVNDLRFVLASATIPNIEDLCQWLRSGSGKTATEVAQFAFSDMQRAVPLEKYVLGFSSKLEGFKFDMSLNYRLGDVLRKYAEQQAALIFCNSRKSAEMAANTLINEIAKIYAFSDLQRVQLAQFANSIQDSKLRKLLPHGVAFHHAGMNCTDRNHVEDAFRKGHLMVLLCTNSLAMGVNLPAHLVVIKSTESYCHGRLQEYTESAILQMIGRAGRPQYDTKGVAVILTSSKQVHKYKCLMNGKMPVESHLHKHLAEHLNSEIALGTITNLKVAMNWLHSTYFYVRAIRNPSGYGFAAETNALSVEKKLEEICLSEIEALHTVGLITKHMDQRVELQTTIYGKLMAKYYLCFETMKRFRELQGTESLLQILEMIVRCQEFNDFTVRVNEKKVLNELNQSPVRFPIKGRIKTREQKISCLLQAVLGNLQISSPGLAQETSRMFRLGDRVAKCLLEYLRLSSTGVHPLRGGYGYKALVNAATIAKCFHAKLWENSEYVGKQLRKIGTVCSSLLAQAGKTTLKSIAETDARTIELILNKLPPFGDEVLQNLLSFPEYTLHIQQPMKSNDVLQISVRQINEHYARNGAKVALIVGDSENNLLCFIENIETLLLDCEQLDRNVKLVNCKVESIHAHIIHATLAGVDVCSTYDLNKPVNVAKDQPEIKQSNKRKRQSKINVSMAKQKKTNVISLVESEQHKETTSILEKFSYRKSKLASVLQNTSCRISGDTHNEIHTIDAKTNVAENGMEDSNVSTVANSHYTPAQSKITDYFGNEQKTKLLEDEEASVEADNIIDLVAESTSNNNNNNEKEKENCSTSALKMDKTLMNATTITTIGTDMTNEFAVGRCDAVLSEQTDNTNISLHVPQHPNEIALDLTCNPNATRTISSGDNSKQKRYISNLCKFLKTTNELKNISRNLGNLQQRHKSNNDVSIIMNKHKLRSNRTMQMEKIVNGPLNLTKTVNFDKENEKSEKENVSEQMFHLWHQVAVNYSKLKSAEQTYEGFKRIYYKISTEKNQEKTHRSHTRDNKKLSLCANNDNVTLPISTKARNRQQPADNRFRLQLQTANSPATSRNEVTQNNSALMSLVLTQKCIQNGRNGRIGAKAMCAKRSDDLESRNTEDLTFEDYCRLCVNEDAVEKQQ